VSRLDLFVEKRAAQSGELCEFSNRVGKFSVLISDQLPLHPRGRERADCKFSDRVGKFLIFDLHRRTPLRPDGRQRDKTETDSIAKNELG
jgi:hypothetical protein